MLRQALHSYSPQCYGIDCPQLLPSLSLDFSSNNVTEVPASFIPQVTNWHNGLPITLAVNLSGNPIRSLNESMFNASTINIISLTLDMSNPTRGPIRLPASNFSYASWAVQEHDLTLHFNLVNTGIDITVMAALTAQNPSLAGIFSFNLSSNGYTIIPRGAFYGVNASLIDLRSNAISFVNPAAFDTTFEIILGTVDLSNNLLQAFSIEVSLAFPPMTRVILSNNSIAAVPSTGNLHLQSPTDGMGNILHCSS
jgi:hypothetical protein